MIRLAAQADIGSKRLISLDPQAWVRWVMATPDVVYQELLNSDFQWLGRQGDVLIRAWTPEQGELLIANEIQLRYSVEMPRRMRLYTA